MLQGREHIWISHFNRAERKSSAHREAGIADELAVLPRSFSEHPSDVITRTLTAAREHLEMDVAFVAEFADGRLRFRLLEGDAMSFGFEEGEGIPLEGSFCKRVVDGRLPSVVRDAKNDERVKHLAVTRDSDIGSYIGVPLRFMDGRLYGTFCCLSHSSDPDLRDRDAKFMKVFARLIAEQLEREERESKTWRLRMEAAGVGALLAALEARDGYTGEHSTAVLELSAAVARRLGLSEEEVTDVKQAALLHDIGKIGILDSILNKPGPLDEEEWEVMQEHPKIGERIVSSIESLAHLAPIIRSGHERWDGKGYPEGLSGEEIPLASCIIFACDSFHAMISDRPYRAALGIREALEEIGRNSGTQFCPNIVRALFEVVNEGRQAKGEARPARASAG